ncbi:cytochrome P450 [Flammeovirgaceae bacterium]
MSTEIRWNPFDPAYIRDPYRMYKQLQENDPVHCTSRNEWVITRYDDVKSVLKSPAVRVGNRKEWFEKGINYFNQGEADLRYIHEAIHSFILFLNPPDHTRIRNFVNKAWTNRNISNIIAENIEYLLSQIRNKEFDLVNEFAQPLPILTISKVLGIPPADYEYLKDLGKTMIGSINLYHNYRELVALSDAANKFITYFTNQIQLKTDHPDEVLISQLIQQNQIDKELNEKELVSICIFLFIAGEETTAASISTGILHLLRQRHLYEYLKVHPGKLPVAMEELLRYDSPVQLLGRITTTEIIVNGVTIPPESSLIVVLAAANRDPRIFEQPDELNFERVNKKHLTFGWGPHFCMGEWLGRAEITMGINAILKTYPNLDLMDKNGW